MPTSSSDKRNTRRKPTVDDIRSARRYLGASPDVPLPSPQALAHFRSVDQIRELQGVAERDPDLGFFARLLSLVAFPRRDPGDAPRWVRRNGPYELVVTAHGSEGGLPYGVIPRLLLAWVSTEAVRTRSPTLHLGGSVLRFMERVGLAPHRSGGRNGAHSRIQDQARRLFDSTIQLVYIPPDGPRRKIAGPVADSQTLWSEYRMSERHAGGLATTVVLGERFYREIVSRPIPINLALLRSLRRSSLGIDLYLWLTYRVFTLREPLQVSWRALYAQFGPPDAEPLPHRLSKFRIQCHRELGKISLAWPELRYQTKLSKGAERSRFIVYPSPPSIPVKTADPDDHLRA